MGSVTANHKAAAIHEATPAPEQSIPFRIFLDPARETSVCFRARPCWLNTVCKKDCRAMKIISPRKAALAAAVSISLTFIGTALAQQPRTLKIQSAVPPSSTTQDALKFFAERVEKLTGGNLKIEALPGGAVVPPFEILD